MYTHPPSYIPYTPPGGGSWIHQMDSHFQNCFDRSYQQLWHIGQNFGYTPWNPYYPVMPAPATPMAPGHARHPGTKPVRG
jgi:hypothetical protein